MTREQEKNSIFSRKQGLLIFNLDQPLEMKPQVVQSGSWYLVAAQGHCLCCGLAKPVSIMFGLPGLSSPVWHMHPICPKPCLPPASPAHSS